MLQQLYGPNAAQDYDRSKIVKTHDGKEFECAFIQELDLVREAMAEQQPINQVITITLIA